jgi:hypothetical protein
MITTLPLQSKKITEEDGSFHFKNIKLFIQEISVALQILGEMTSYVLNHKDESNQRRDTKDFKKNMHLKNQMMRIIPPGVGGCELFGWRLA